jgi:antitoxin component YwqK of YwqJK toxin-antitoxin module
MKHLLAPILLLTLLFPSLAYGVTLDDLVVRDGLHYEKFTDVPFTGKVTPNLKTGGWSNTQGYFKNGKKHGPYATYWNNGQLLSKGNYKDGEKDGPWVKYFNNGKLFFKGNYKDDKKQGPWVWYHDNGQLQSKGNYKDEKMDGPWVWYKLYGTVNPEYTGTYKDGVKVD